MNSQRPADEVGRLEMLRRLGVLDTPAEPVFDMLATMAARSCDTPIALLAFIDEDRDWFKARIGTEIWQIPRDVSICTYTIQGSEMFIVPDALEDPRFRNLPIVTSPPALRFYAGMPIRFGDGSAVGTLCVIDTKARTLTPGQASALEDLAALVTAQLEARLPRHERALLDHATRLNAELSALLEVTDSAVSTLDLDRLIAVLLERLVRVMRADAGAILLEDGGRLVVRASAGFSATDGEPPSIPSDAGIGGRILATGGPVYVADVRNDPQVVGSFLAEQGITSMLGVPLRARDQLVGVLHVDWRGPHAKSASDLRLLETAAERCAAAIVNAQLYAELSVTNEEAARARERLTLALSAADLGVWDWDVPSGRVFWDVTNERIFGLEPGAFDGNFETFRRLVHPEDFPSVENAINTALAGADYAPWFRIIRPDGAVRWLAAYGHFQRTPDGAPLRLLGVTEDVTEERQLADERELLLAGEHEARAAAELAEQRLKATNEQLRALSARIQTVREEEAVRIAREIHDELGQLLTALRMDVGWIRTRVASLQLLDTAPLLSRADAMAELTERTIRTVQRISEELRPAALDQLGLEAAIEVQLAELEQRCGIHATLSSSLGERRLGDRIETGVFRIVQELLTNVARHSGASKVVVELFLKEQNLLVRVSDDGRGILPAEVVAPKSLGLVGIRERAMLLGGAAELRGTPGDGTIAFITIPCEGVEA